MSASRRFQPVQASRLPLPTECQAAVARPEPAGESLPPCRHGRGSVDPELLVPPARSRGSRPLVLLESRCTIRHHCTPSGLSLPSFGVSTTAQEHFAAGRLLASGASPGLLPPRLRRRRVACRCTAELGVICCPRRHRILPLQTLALVKGHAIPGRWCGRSARRRSFTGLPFARLELRRRLLVFGLPEPVALGYRGAALLLSSASWDVYRFG